MEFTLRTMVIIIIIIVAVLVIVTMITGMGGDITKFYEEGMKPFKDMLTGG